jgi:hypothetical protein
LENTAGLELPIKRNYAGMLGSSLNAVTKHSAGERDAVSLHVSNARFSGFQKGAMLISLNCKFKEFSFGFILLHG